MYYYYSFLCVHSIYKYFHHMTHFLKNINFSCNYYVIVPIKTNSVGVPTNYLYFCVCCCRLATFFCSQNIEHWFGTGLGLKLPDFIIFDYKKNLKWIVVWKMVKCYGILYFIFKTCCKQRIWNQHIWIIFWNMVSHPMSIFRKM